MRGLLLLLLLLSVVAVARVHASCILQGTTPGTLWACDVITFGPPVEVPYANITASAIAVPTPAGYQYTLPGLNGRDCNCSQQGGNANILATQCPSRAIKALTDHALLAYLLAGGQTADNVVYDCACVAVPAAVPPPAPSPAPVPASSVAPPTAPVPSPAASPVPAPAPGPNTMPVPAAGTCTPNNSFPWYMAVIAVAVPVLAALGVGISMYVRA